MSDVKLPQKNVRRAVRMTLSAAIGLTPLALALPAQAGTIGTGTTTVTYSGSIVDYTVGTTGLYDITAYGANGGSSPFAAGGTGGEIGGEFNLSAGDALSILVGGAGVDYVSGNYSSVGGGGGGGTFVILGNRPLVVAGAGGGGGGGVGFASGAGGYALTGVNGGKGGTGSGGAIGGAGGIHGSGASAGSTRGGGGGGGYFDAGAGGYSGGGSGGGYGGNGFNGGRTGAGTGGAGFSGGNGGFGGGGGVGFNFGGGGGGGGYSGGGGGGGGGYSGGSGGGGGGGGGGSFLAAGALNTVEIAKGNTLDLGGNGEVTFTLESAPPVSAPEPGTFALLGAGLLGIGLATWRRKRGDVKS